MSGPALVEPRLALLGRFEIEVADPQRLGRSHWGDRRIVNVTGGRFSGPEIRGVVLPGGADWQVVHDDGMTSVEARYTLETDDGALIYVISRGVRRGLPEILERIGRGEVVDPREYYFRVSLQYETGSPRYAALNGAVVVGSAIRLKNTVIYDAYVVE